ncbi:MAG: DUF4355 domain-containing protein [Desulfobacterales bacterium]|nr:DUF4355 domain-containing protein [Desulfobacterales bacterium]
MAETVTAEVTETVTTTEPQAQLAVKTAAELQAEVARMEKALKEANKEAADRRKKLEALEKADQERRDAELSEQDKLKREVETLRTQAQAAERAVLQRDIAAELGLPATFATRIVGADRDAMLADAKALLDAMPKANVPSMSATNPGGAAAVTETIEQKRRRLGLA